MKENINNSLDLIQSTLKSLLIQVEQAEYKSEDETGILTGDTSAYKECLELDSVKFERLSGLLEQDQARW